jgi:hypothetical protein
MTGPSVTVHGATFYFFNSESMAIGKVRGRDVTIQAPAGTPAQWTPILQSLRWVCRPVRAHCSGW